MSILWWLFIISIFFYPTFIFLMIFSEKYPNTKLGKWWEKYIVEKEKL